MIVATENGSVDLYYDDSKKFETKSNGAGVTGSQLTLEDSSGTVISFDESGTRKAFIGIRSFAAHDGDGIMIQTSETAPIKFAINNVIKAKLDSNGDFVPGANNASNLGTSSNRWSDVYIADDIYLNDGGLIRFGTSGSDMLMQHTGGHNFIEGGSGFSGNLYIRAKLNENGITLVSDGAAELYYDNSKKFFTSSSGAQVTGSLQLTEHLNLNNGKELKLGDSSQMTIWHSGSDFNMYNNSGQLIISNASGTGVGEGEIVFKTGSNNTRWRMLSGGDFIPASNNAFAIGSSSNRVSIIYSNAALNTSDKTLKNTITTSDLGLDFINKLKPVSYKWNQYEGEISDTRTHYGLIAQDVEEVITSSGKTLNDFGGVDKPDEGCMGLAYSQFISPLIKAVQELSAKVETLETKVAVLEAT